MRGARKFHGRVLCGRFSVLGKGELVELDGRFVFVNVVVSHTILVIVQAAAGSVIEGRRGQW